MIIDGRKIAQQILEEVREGVAALPVPPIFCDVVVGDDPASLQYVRMKARTAESIGIKFRSANFPETITTEELINEIENLNRVPHMCGVIVQLPLPSHIDKQAVLDAINISIDVDCLGTNGSTLFYKGENPLGFPTALACIKALDSIGISLDDKNIVMLGQGMLVGRPVTHFLRSRGLSVTTVASHTENTREILKTADVIISGIGHGKFITGDMVKEGVIIVDAGTSEEDGGIVGDVDLDTVLPVASHVSPTPGGVGPITVAMLLKNVLIVAKRSLL